MSFIFPFFRGNLTQCGTLIKLRTTEWRKSKQKIIVVLQNLCCCGCSLFKICYRMSSEKICAVVFIEHYMSSHEKSSVNILKWKFRSSFFKSIIECRPKRFALSSSFEQYMSSREKLSVNILKLNFWSSFNQCTYCYSLSCFREIKQYKKTTRGMEQWAVGYPKHSLVSSYTTMTALR